MSLESITATAPPSPLPTQFAYAQFHPLIASVRPTFPDGAIILGSIVSRFLARPNFSHPSSLVLRFVAERHEGRPSIHQFRELEHTCSIIRRLKNSDIISLLLERETLLPVFFYHLLAKKISKAVFKYY